MLFRAEILSWPEIIGLGIGYGAAILIVYAVVRKFVWPAVRLLLAA